MKEATDESERLREEWADARDGAKYSRDEHLAALEALEFSTRMATIEECVRACEAVADRLRPYAPRWEWNVEWGGGGRSLSKRTAMRAAEKYVTASLMKSHGSTKGTK